MIKPTEKQKEVLAANGHTLVKGGPGSGKTAISILKARAIIKNRLKHWQHVLFLSFARATVFRVLEAIDEESELPPDVKHQIEVNTYHAFFWQLIKTHGYLLGLPRSLDLLTPSNEAVALSKIRNKYKAGEKKKREDAERYRLAKEEGQICFDLFAKFAGQLLHGSTKIRRLISNAYPTIILDEFQDTSADQWRVIQALGHDSELLALADPEQRIFDFLGADPKRLDHFIEKFEVTPIDLGNENHRSKATDITQFGNDILRSQYSKSSYNGIYFALFESNENQAFATLMTETVQAQERLIESKKNDWSLAILVPTKRMTQLISNVFREPVTNFPRIEHHAVIDMEAAILAAEVIAYALQSHGAALDVNMFVTLIEHYFRGKSGDKVPKKKDLEEAVSIFEANKEAANAKSDGKKIGKNRIFWPIEKTFLDLSNLTLTGDPAVDWIAVQRHFEHAQCKRLKEIAIEARNIRLLQRGTQLRESLSQNWRDRGHYSNALEIVKQAFIQDHFSFSTKLETGVVVMNMHKAKGKQFDEVIIFEGWSRWRHRIVRTNIHENIDDQARQNFRVSVTRAKNRTTILTPRENPCVLLTPHS